MPYDPAGEIPYGVLFQSLSKKRSRPDATFGPVCRARMKLLNRGCRTTGTGLTSRCHDMTVPSPHLPHGCVSVSSKTIMGFEVQESFA
jgi:hypothetical protein